MPVPSAALSGRPAKAFNGDDAAEEVAKGMIRDMQSFVFPGEGDHGRGNSRMLEIRRLISLGGQVSRHLLLAASGLSAVTRRPHYFMFCNTIHVAGLLQVRKVQATGSPRPCSTKDVRRSQDLFSLILRVDRGSQHLRSPRASRFSRHICPLGPLIAPPARLLHRS